MIEAQEGAAGVLGVLLSDIGISAVVMNYLLLLYL